MPAELITQGARFEERLTMNDKASALEPLVQQLRSLMKDDEALPAERPLAEMLGVKRHQLRRALQLVRGRSQTQAPSGRRARVARKVTPSIRYGNTDLMAPPALVAATSPIEVIEMRLAIEAALARMAAVRATPAEIDAMQDLLDTSSGEGQTRAADIAFHRAIAEAAHSTLALAVHGVVSSLDSDSRLHVVLPGETLAVERQQHQAIMDAISARDSEAAERAMISHLRSVELWLLRRRTG
jgi:GntR family transcriptional regulator, transcriptional repressor for pyruvate dehydrogenase complex